MSKFTLQQDGYTSYTTVSNCFIEQFMPHAAGEFVKIYIYLLKCISENRSELSVSRIADAFNNTEKDVVRAFKYWQKKGLLKLTFDENNALASLRMVPLSDRVEEADGCEDDDRLFSVTDAPIPGNHSNNIKHTAESTANAADVEAQTAAPAEEELLQPVQIPERREYTKAEIAAFSGQEEVAELLFIASRYLGKNLSNKETDTVLYIYDTLGFPAELIEYLFEYCVGRNHRSMRYIEKTAMGWAEAGIRTVRAAKIHAGLYSDECYKVMNAFGISGRKPTKNETEFVTRWYLSYGFDINIITAACTRTMDQLHQPSFEYTDAILKNWKSKGVETVEDIDRLDREFEFSAASARRELKSAETVRTNKAAASSRFNNFHQRTYDYKELEQKLFNK